MTPLYDDSDTPPAFIKLSKKYIDKREKKDIKKKDHHQNTGIISCTWIFGPKTLPGRHKTLPHRHRSLPLFLRQSRVPRFQGPRLYLKYRSKGPCLDFWAQYFISQARIFTLQARIFTSQAQDFTLQAWIFTSKALIVTSIFEVKSLAQDQGAKTLPQNSR